MSRTNPILAAATAAALVVSLAAGNSARAATINLNVGLKGVSKTSDGRSFPFTGTGTGTLDDTTGGITFTVNASNGLTFTGTGNAFPGTKNTFGIVQIQSNAIFGTMVLDGKTNARTRKFTGKYYIVFPNRLGAPPAGTVFSSGSLSISPAS